MPISESIVIPYIYERPLPDFQKDDDIKFPDTLVRVLLEKFTKPNDKIFDPFTGLGTSFFVCEEMERVPYGIEADKNRYNYVCENTTYKDNLIFGDSGDIDKYNFPKIDFSLTSPPYMPDHHKWNPLYNGNPEFAGYDCYLERMQEIYRQISKIMKRNAYVIVQADNLTNPLCQDSCRIYC